MADHRLWIKRLGHPHILPVIGRQVGPFLGRLFPYVIRGFRARPVTLPLDAGGYEQALPAFTRTDPSALARLAGSSPYTATLVIELARTEGLL